MNNLQEIYNGYLAVELEKRKIAEKICDKERSIRRLEKQIKKLEHKRYSDGWVKCLVEPLAKVLARFQVVKNTKSTARLVYGRMLAYTLKNLTLKTNTTVIVCL